MFLVEGMILPRLASAVNFPVLLWHDQLLWSRQDVFDTDELAKRQSGIWPGFAPPARNRPGDLRKLCRIDILIFTTLQRRLSHPFPSA